MSGYNVACPHFKIESQVAVVLVFWFWQPLWHLLNVRGTKHTPSPPLVLHPITATTSKNKTLVRELNHSPPGPPGTIFPFDSANDPPNFNLISTTTSSVPPHQFLSPSNHVYRHQQLYQAGQFNQSFALIFVLCPRFIFFESIDGLSGHCLCYNIFLQHNFWSVLSKNCAQARGNLWQFT